MTKETERTNGKTKKVPNHSLKAPFLFNEEQHPASFVLFDG
ncbi:hypothetical protein B4168_0754 [Anoxybacillus flavithermus]|nr:hypothetical protein B4168_0754 [Anoxybacillus flavithermus]